jgi:two-component system chemotaxis response regulator CheB
MADKPTFIIVIGASAGGLNALTELVAQLDTEIDAAIFIVLHLSRKGISDFLVHQLQKNTSLRCEIAIDQKPIEKGCIYVALPNQHLLVKEYKVIIGHGPEENRWRPSIDVLFRSAAVAFDGKVIGIILTGLLDDGTAGMWAIKRSGGICIVQDPNEAEYPEMPLSVLNKMEVDYCISLAEMAKIITEVIKNKRSVSTEIPAELIAESEISEKVATGTEEVSQLGDKSIFACPDCGGGLWKITNGNITRYRCHIGHSYSERDLLIKQAETLETTLWVSLRMMEERKNMLIKLENDHKKKGMHSAAEIHKQKAEEIEVHIQRLKEILFATQQSDQS